MSKITYANKVAINENAEIPNINKVTDSDMNEIKAVVNNNDDELITINTKLTNLITYSTTETVVGTWIDGKTIYKRTFTGNSGSARTNATITIAENQPIDVLISVEGVYQNKTASSKLYQAFGSDTSALVYDTAGTSANNVIFFINNSSSASFDYYITLYYTKTTD